MDEGLQYSRPWSSSGHLYIGTSWICSLEWNSRLRLSYFRLWLTFWTDGAKQYLIYSLIYCFNFVHSYM